MSKRFIIKAQVSLATTSPVRQVLLYNEDRSIEWQGDVNEEVFEAMAGHPKRYFWARRKGSQIELLAPAPEQHW